MRSSKELKETYALLEQLICASELFRQRFPGESARQFTLGAAAALDWVLGHETRPFCELLAYIRKPLAASGTRVN